MKKDEREVANSAFKEKKSRGNRLGLRTFVVVNGALVASSIDVISTIIHLEVLVERGKLHKHRCQGSSMGSVCIK